MPASSLDRLSGSPTGTSCSPDTQYFRYDVLGRKTWEIGELAPNGLRLAKRFTYREADDKVTLIESGTLTSPTDPNLAVFEQSATTYDARRYPIREATLASGATHRVTDRSFLDRGMAECTTVRMNLAALPAATSTGACALGTQGSQGPDRITRNLYDNAAQLTKVQKAYLIPAEQADYVTYTYTLNGKQQFVTDANGNKAELRYDGFDRQSHWFMPSKTVAGQVSTTDYEQYGYDAAGNRTSLRKRDGRTLTFAYDNLNRLTSKLIPDGCAPIQVGPCTPASATRDVFSAYDLMGRQTSARYDSQAGIDGVTNTYNRFGEMTSSSIAMAGFSKTLTHLYDEAGRRTRLTHPDGQAFTYAYDALDRLSGVYEGVGTATSLDTFGYDNRGLLASRTERLGSGAGYSYDPIGRLASQTDSFVGGIGNVGWTFTHNPASQIVTETRDNDGYAYTGLSAVNRAYAVNGLNQYSTVAGTALTYDANGNLIGDGTNAYVYDAENRLVSATAAGQTATLTYDPLGRLWQLVEGGSNTRFMTDGDAMVAEYDGAGAMTARYVHGSNMAADDPLVWYQGATTRWLHANHQGSVVAVTNGSGGSPSINSYDEYGVPGAGNVGRFQYTGQMWLSEIGLYYYKARFYSAALGRFLQVDPVGYDDQFNLYTYVGNDPVNAVDPSGERELTPQEKGMLQKTFGSGIHLLQVFSPRALPRSVTTPYAVLFSLDRYSSNFAAEENTRKINTFWHEFYHVFELSYGIKSWASMALSHVGANIPSIVSPPGTLDQRLYDWQPGKTFAQQTYEARAGAFGNCMSGAGCANLEGMSIKGAGVSLSFNNGEFTLKETVTGSRIPRISNFKPQCVEQENCN